MYIVVIYILIITIFNFLNPNRSFSEQENRELQQMPHFSIDRLKSGKFTKEFENYIADQFLMRDFWVSVKSKIELDIGKKENNDVYYGKDGYLIQKFAEGDKEDTRKKIDSLNMFFKAVPAANKYVMLVPTSIDVLKEKLPKYAPTENEEAYINKIKKGLADNAKFINVQDTLSSKKNMGIYYKTDHHWTTEGAFYAYKKFCSVTGINSAKADDFAIKEVTSNFYGTSYSKGGFRNVKPDTIKLYTLKTKENCTVEFSDSREKYDSFYFMNNLKKKDKYSVFFDGNHPLVKISTASKSKKKIVIVKDSYANSFVPFLQSNYSEIYMVDLRYYEDSIEQLVKTNKIDDVLILYNVNSFSQDDSIENIS